MPGTECLGCVLSLFPTMAAIEAASAIAMFKRSMALAAMFHWMKYEFITIDFLGDK
jgi:hypothetical protein